MHGGGLTGGAIDGAFTVFVQSEAGAPVAGAQVQLSEHLDAVGRSDAAGQVDFYGEALSGALDVHVFHESYPFASMIEVTQSVATTRQTRSTADGLHERARTLERLIARFETGGEPRESGEQAR